MSSRARTSPDAPRRPRIDRRQAIIDAAIALSAEKPFDEVNVADIAKRAGVSHGLLFYYFRDKWAVTTEALQQLLRELHDFQSPRPSETTPRERATGFTRRHIEFVQDRTDSYLALLRGGAMSRPEVQALLHEARQEGITTIAGILELPEPISPMLTLALAAWAASLDVCTEHVLGGAGLDLDAVVEWAVERLLDGVAASQT